MFGSVTVHPDCDALSISLFPSATARLLANTKLQLRWGVWYSWSSTQGHGGFTFPSQVVWDLVKARSEHKQKAASHIYVCSLLT
jgi:hypothetical protein